MLYFTRPVVYFEESDFDENGQLIDLSDQIVFILLQSLKCYHCTNAKPAFQKFAEKYDGKIICGTIQIDSPRMTPSFLKKVESIYPNLVGFPSYILYNKGKKIIYDGDRSVDNMERFMNEVI